MAQVYIPKPEQARIRPAYTVQKLDGKRKVAVYEFTKDGKRAERIKEVDAGYLVTFLRGHSIRVSEDDLVRLGFDQTVPLVDGEGYDEAVGHIPSNVMTSRNANASA